MADKIIAASLQVDTGDSNKQIKEVKDNLSGVRDELKQTNTEAGKTNETVQQTGGSFGKLKEQLLNIPGPVGQAAQGVQGLGTAFKALLANPIVLTLAAIVGALGLLFKAFSSTRKGADLIGQGMAFVGGAIDKVMQIIGDFITGITSIGDLFGKIGSFISNPIKGFRDLAKEVGNAANETARLKKEQQDLERDQINNLARNKELIQQQEALKNIRDNEFNSTAKRIEANEKAAALEKQRLATLEQLQLREVKRLQQLIELKGGEAKATNEQLKELREAELELADIREESIGRENEFITNRFGLQKEAEEKAKAAREAAIAKQKEETQKLADFNNRLLQLQQANQLATLQDGYDKELKALDFKIANEKAALDQQVKDQKLTKQQAAILSAELDKQQQLEAAAIKAKSDEEVKAKEQVFQDELAKLRQETQLKGITDSRELERVQLEIGYEEKLQDAIQRYRDDAAKLSEVQREIAEQQRLDTLALEEKFRQEDEERKLAEAEKAAEEVANDPTQSFEARQAALDQEQAAFQAALDAKVITEQQYNEKVKALTEARKNLATEEANQRMATFGAIGNAFETLSNLIGKKTAAGKALAVASATIAAIQSAVSSFNSLAPIPIVGPALGAVAAAAAIASGIANVKKIVSVKVPGESGGGGSVPSISTPAAPLAPTQQSTRIDASSIQDIGNAQSGKAIKTFVVDSDTGNARDRQARLERASILGG